MADEALREAERRWLETGAVEDEGRYLLERVRAGTLTREWLELAAYCRHAAAMQVLGTPPDLGERRWLEGLRRWPPEVAVHAAATADIWRRAWYQAQDPEHSRQLAETDQGRADARLRQALSCWHARPSGATVAAVALALKDARAVHRHVPGGVIAGLVGSPSAPRALALVRDATRFLPGGRRGQQQARRELADAVRAALIRWALAAPP